MLSFKVILKGHHGVGRTSILAKFANQSFDPSECVDIQPDYKIIVTLDKKEYELEVLDVPDDYQMGDYFTKNGHGFLLIYSITDFQSFEAVKSSRNKIVEIKHSDQIPIVLVGNKRDLGDSSRAVAENEAKQLASSWPNCNFIEITATDHNQVQEAFKMLLREMLAAESTDDTTTQKYRCSIL